LRKPASAILCAFEREQLKSLEFLLSRCMAKTHGEGTPTVQRNQAYARH